MTVERQSFGVGPACPQKKNGDRSYFCGVDFFVDPGFGVYWRSEEFIASFARSRISRHESRNQKRKEARVG